MSCVTVLDSNLIDEAAAFSVSSEQANYPGANALDLNRRRRVWRSAGHWFMQTGSNVLRVRDAAGGADLDATVTPGHYATDALFFAALKSALEAVSDSTFTVTRDATTNRVKITAALGGAATAFQIRAADAACTLAPLLGYALTNLSGALFYVADELRLHTSEYLMFDFGFPVSPSAVLAVADRNRPLRVTPGSSVRIRGNLTNDFWTVAPQVDIACEVGDYAIAYADQDGIGGIPCRYWLLEVTDPANAYGYVELGAVVLGTHISLARGSVDFPMQDDDEDLSPQEYSEGGQLVSQKRAQTEYLRLDWNGLSNADFEAVNALFGKVGLHSPFAVLLDGADDLGNLALSTDMLLWAKLVRFRTKPSKRVVSPGNWSVSWELREDL